MNKKLTTWLFSAAMISIVSIAAYGDELPASSTPSTTATPAPTISATATPSATVVPYEEDKDKIKKEAGITPDNILYPIERLIESVRVNMTFYAEGKADLLVSFANERLAEASVMTDENKLELVQKVLKIYAQTVEEANKNLEEAANNDKNISGTLDEIKIMEDQAGQVVIKVSGIISKEIEDELKSAITAEVKKTLVIKSFMTAKESFNDAKKAFEQAKEELKLAEASGDQIKIAAAKVKLAQAEVNKDQLEQIKDEIEEYKEEIKKLLEDKDEEDKDEQKPATTPVSAKTSDKEDDKIEKIESQIEKLQEKRQEIIEHVSDKPGKAAEKIKENTDKQIEKKEEKIEKFQEKDEVKQEKTEKAEKSKGKKD